MACRTVLSTSIAQKYLNEVKEDIQSLGLKPKLLGLLANDDPGSIMYSDWTAKTCNEAGVQFELRIVHKNELEDAIGVANEEKDIHGIIVYFPVFGDAQDKYLQQIVDASKDVEGLSQMYVQNLYHNIRYLDNEGSKKSVLPCTPLAVVKILEHLNVYNTILEYSNRLYGRTITIVNRSEIVGRPLAALLANDGAVVYSVDIKDVQRFTRGSGIRLRRHQVESTDLKLDDVAPISDVIISGVPGDYKFDSELVKHGAVCINFASQRNFDSSVKERASVYVPATGKVTISMLLRNLLRLIRNNLSS